MAAELVKLAGQFREKGFEILAASLDAQAQIARQLGAPESFSIEQPVGIRKFSDQTKDVLKQEGYLVYPLTGQSIRSLREAGKPFWSTWHRDYPDFENLPSRLSEVAINPDPKKFFLPKSNSKTLTEQEEMIKDYSKQLAKRLVSVKAVLGEAPDYVELAFAHLDATGEYLFGEKYSYDYTRTKTLTAEARVACVGGFVAADGLSIDRWRPDDSISGLWSVPLVVPSRD